MSDKQRRRLLLSEVPETQAKRLQEAIQLLKQNQKLGLV
jgi:hypothetical protein